MIFPPPAGKDGFLATNSLLGFTSLIARAYAAEFSAESGLGEHGRCWRPCSPQDSQKLAAWEAATAALWQRPTTFVLHGPDTRIGAIDLEVEVHRGRYGELAGRRLPEFRSRSASLAGETRRGCRARCCFRLGQRYGRAERTLALIPTDIPQARIEIAGPTVATGLGVVGGGL